MPSNEVEVYFALDGSNIDHNDITKRLGIQPSLIKQYDLKNDKSNKQQSQAWVLSSGKIIDEFADVYNLSLSLIEKLEPNILQMLDCIKQYNLTSRFQVVIWFSTDVQTSTPAIGFDERTISFLGKIGASIDIDTYLH